MTSYSVTLAASAGLTLLIATTSASQHQPTVHIGVVPIEQSRYPMVASPTVLTMGSEISFRTLNPIITEAPYIPFMSQDKAKLRIAQAVGGAATIALILFITFSVINFVNFAIWLPAIPALIGLMATAGAYIERLERSH